MEKRTRPRQVKFWVTEDELEKINKQVKKSKLTKQEYLLRSALNKKITVILGLKEILLELSREGNNFRAISKELKENKNFNADELIEMQEKLTALWETIDKTLKEGRK